MVTVCPLLHPRVWWPLGALSQQLPTLSPAYIISANPAQSEGLNSYTFLLYLPLYDSFLLLFINIKYKYKYKQI